MMLIKRLDFEIDDLNSKALRFRSLQRKSVPPSFKRCLKNYRIQNSTSNFFSSHTQLFTEGNMAKRFTDTNKWGKNNFGELSLKMKLVWIYLCDNCDHAGVWDINMGLMSFQVGEKITLSDLEDSLKNKIKIIHDDKLLMPSFIEFQYGELNPENRVHKSVIERLSRLGVNYKGLNDPNKGLMSSMEGCKDKDKDKDKDMDKDKDNMSDAQIITQDELISSFNSICALQGKIERYRSDWLSGNALTDFINRSGSPGYQHVEIWKELFNRVASNEFLCGEDKKKTFVATLPWILKPDNFEIIISGGYPSTRKNKNKPEGPPDGVDYDSWIRQQA